jgi:hypothetical protein
MCPACGGRLRKLFSAVGIVFKGSGFYRTDSRTSTVSGAKDKQLNGSSSDSPATAEKPSGGDAKPSSSGSESPVNGAKPEKKADSGTAKSTGTKVA